MLVEKRALKCKKKRLYKKYCNMIRHVCFLAFLVENWLKCSDRPNISLTGLCQTLYVLVLPGDDHINMLLIDRLNMFCKVWVPLAAIPISDVRSSMLWSTVSSRSDISCLCRRYPRTVYSDMRFTILRCTNRPAALANGNICLKTHSH